VRAIWQEGKHQTATRQESRPNLPAFSVGPWRSMMLSRSTNRSRMKPPRKPAPIAVIWEYSPNPDRHALLKAVAMLFKQRVPLSTGGELTERDEELLCERLDEP
jgi:hypothetical protein